MLWSFFKSHWNFDPVKEILKTRSQICILMKNVIILRKIYLTIKPFALPIKSFFLSCFRMSLNREKRVVMRAMRKKQKKLNIFTLQLLIYYILEQEISIGARGKHLVIQLLWASPRLSVTRVSLIYLVDEFLSSFLV